MTIGLALSIRLTLIRQGVVLEPNGDPTEVEGVFNPGFTRARDGKHLLYPRSVARGNVSRIGLVSIGGSPETPTFTRLGFALEPEAPYEFRSEPGGYGCEDPRITFINALDVYVMAYTAYGPEGPRIAIAVSHDAYDWKRLGLVDFPADLSVIDKDAAFFPEPVLSPSGVLSLGLYHRPMTWTAPPIHPCTIAPIALALAPSARECIRIGYIPLEPVLGDLRKLLSVSESVIVVEPDTQWGRIKVGAGTPPVRISEGWFSLYHAVDVLPTDIEGGYSDMTYSVAAVVHDIERPDVVLYRSPNPIFLPKTPDELHGVVNNVVFPTGIDDLSTTAEHRYDVYYGMADSRVGRMKLIIETGPQR
ncbi:MAG TPA: hypothetical protein VGZ00_03980 [Candidatus Baltobacteraceae bacterium]|jgi:predicted GH43/DUF377 family glycosyl hydrolase|nr:hypothetical protein [Candidatus Baltobacteraceae bacterium]